jgi:RHS repeat-associated protein
MEYMVDLTSVNGSTLAQQRYLPFGKVREDVGTITQTDFGYTGQRDIAGMGLMDYKARFYNDGLGRFIQPDTIVLNPADPQSRNRYSYVQNGPIVFTDPTGHWEDEGCGSGRICDLLKSKLGPRIPDHGEERAESGFMTTIIGVWPAPLIIGSTPPSQPHEGYSDPQLDGLYYWWENFVRTGNNFLASEDLYRLSSHGGWKAVRNALPLGLLEGFVQASRQVYRDTWYQSLSPNQKVLRPAVVGLEAVATDWISDKVGASFGSAGLSVGGPLGAAGGYLAGASYTTKIMDRYWMTEFNLRFLNPLGAWP